MIAQPHWTHEEAVALCILVESVCVQHGCHVALTGGLLYKTGTRKDCDIMFYRIRQLKAIDKDGLFKSLQSVGLKKTSGFGWCHKWEFFGKPVDMLFPDEVSGMYGEQ